MKAAVKLAAVIVIISWMMASAADDLEHQVLTMFSEGAVEMPQGRTTATIEGVTFEPSELKGSLLDYGAHSLIKAFPDYGPADSLIESPYYPGLFAKQPRLDRIYRIVLHDPEQRDALNGELMAYPQVIWSDKNGAGETNFIPDDPHFSLQWGLNNNTVAYADIGAPEAWDLTQGDPNVVVGVLDVGVYSSHPDFGGHVLGETPSTYDDHGTHVAGTIGAVGNNGLGVAGVSWNARIWSKDIAGWDQVDIYNSVIDLIQNRGARILNNSWGGPDFKNLVYDAFKIAHDLGILVIASRGNQNNYSNNYPATYPGDLVVSVGAFTNGYGRSPYCSKGNGLDFMAPGGLTAGEEQRFENIYSTSFSPTYRYLGGTSMAAAFASGITALMAEYNGFPQWADNFRYVLKETCSDMPPSEGYDDETGWGALNNAVGALQYIGPPKATYTCPCEAGSGPYIRYPIGDLEACFFFRVPDFADGIYFIRKYEVWFTTSYALGCPSDMPLPTSTPIVSALSPFSNGWAYSGDQYGTKFCGVVEADWNSLTLRTYVFQVWDLGMNYLGFHPCQPEQCTFGFSATFDVTPDPPTNLSVTPSVNYHPLIQWSASPSYGVTHYKIYRQVHSVEPDWVYIGSVDAAAPRSYEDVTYSTPHVGPIAYWTSLADYTVTACVAQHAESGRPSPVSIKVVVPAYPWPVIPKDSSASNNLPLQYALLPPYPNPFNAVTTIKYALPEPAYVTLEIFNIAGQRIGIPVNETKDAGYYEYIWDASNVPSGTYLYRLRANNFSQSGKVILLK